MANPPRISPTTNRPTPIILGILLIIVILVVAWFFLSREGKHSNPTQGHTEIWSLSHAA